MIAMAQDPAPEPGPTPQPTGAWASAQPPGWVLPTPVAEPTPPPVPAPPPPGWTPAAPQAPRPGVVPLRPLGIGEILDGAVSTLRRYWQVQLGFAAAVVTVVTVLQALALYLVLRDTSALGNNSVDTSGGAATQAAQGVATVIGMLAQIVLQGVLTVVVARAVLGQEITPRLAWTQARPRLWRLVGLSFCVLAMVALVLAVPVLLGIAIGLSTDPDAGWAIGFLGELAAVPCAALLYVRLGVAAPALVLEKATIGTAMRRSMRLVRGSFWRVLGILLLTQVITQMLTGMLALPFLGIGLAVAGTAHEPGAAFYLFTMIGVAIAGVVTYPFSAGVTALLYVDLRMRREGLDLTLARSAAAPVG
jgi:Membrane domain of glycerophosphoryl diester phosphodiesterase